MQSSTIGTQPRARLKGFFCILVPKGRGTRLEFFAASVVFGVILPVLEYLVDAIQSPVFDLFVACAVLIPLLWVTVRRLHDLDFSGWWAVLVFAPFVNLLLCLVLLFKKGTVGMNSYGF